MRLLRQDDAGRASRRYGCAMVPELGSVWSVGRQAPGPKRADIALAAGLLALAQVEVWTAAPDGLEVVFALLALPMCGALAWWRSAPVAVLVAVFAAQLPGAFIDASYAPLYQLLAFLLACFSVASRCPLRWAVFGGLAAEAMFVVGALLDPDAQSLGEVAFAAGMVAIVWSLGRLLYGRGRQLDVLTERSVRLAREQEETRAAIEHERAAIAREVHDLLAHTVSVMVVQAGAAEGLLDQDPQRAREPLRHIRRRGHDAVLELRGLLTMLRGEPVALSPQPRLSDLDQLVEETRGAGLSVKLSADGELDQIPAGVQLAAFRIVQEALTNVRKHARASSVEVKVACAHGQVEVQIADDGRGPHGHTRGHGLIGMQERAALYGGTMNFGARAGGGFAVDARLPVRANGRWSAS
jgi:signal transduction histidine kinase